VGCGCDQHVAAETLGTGAAQYLGSSESGYSFCIDNSGLKNKTDFWKNLKTAIEYGLPKERALEALTTLPASLIKADNRSEA
jgi:hypothetical protein